MCSHAVNIHIVAIAAGNSCSQGNLVDRLPDSAVRIISYLMSFECHAPRSILYGTHKRLLSLYSFMSYIDIIVAVHVCSSSSQYSDLVAFAVLSCLVKALLGVRQRPE